MKRLIVLALIAVLVGVFSMSCSKDIEEVAGPIVYDTTIVVDTVTTYDTTIVYDSTTMFDTVIVVDTIIQYDSTTTTVYDTTIVIDTVIQHDSTTVYDTTIVVDTAIIYVPTFIYDTTIVVDTVIQHDTTVVVDTIVVYNAIVVYDASFYDFIDASSFGEALVVATVTSEPGGYGESTDRKYSFKVEIYGDFQHLMGGMYATSILFDKDGRFNESGNHADTAYSMGMRWTIDSQIRPNVFIWETNKVTVEWYGYYPEWRYSEWSAYTINIGSN